ncbi:MAG: ATP-binding protein [Planctomycetota bacterium]
MTTSTHATDQAPDVQPSLLKRLKEAVVLPPAMTAFESSYLRRMNRIALWFFYGHLPVFMAVAALNGTGVLSVALLTLAVLAVPTVGMRALSNQRHRSYVLAFTSMCMGGVLVHAGQGPVQIEMHFYFFSILAMLALFANPMTVIVGAATVAVHHLALWYVAPSSVFNYDAPLWVVLVHAAFVVLETVAASFIARNFFDNVIGLEKKVEQRTAELNERNQEMAAVLDSIEQGIVRVDAGCLLQPEHSPAIREFFGDFEPDESFADYLSRSCVTTAEWFRMNWESIDDGFLPLELALDQLPKAARIEERNYLFSYRPEVHSNGDLESLLIVVTDNTSEVARQNAESLQRELLTMLERALRDARGFSAFHTEATALLNEITDPVSPEGSPEEKRALHTMKGNAAAFGLDSVARACHALEDAWSEANASMARTSFQSLEQRWNELSSMAKRLLGQQDADTISVRACDLERAFQAACENGATDVAKTLAELLLEPTSPVLERLADQAVQVAARLEKGEIRTRVESNQTRVKREGFDDFFSSLTHVVRNAVDHGLELPAEREAATKDPIGTVQITTEVSDGCLITRVEDDGRGVDWEHVAEKAQRLGMPHEARKDLVNAIFSPEFSTREDVTETSGRGVGLSAVKEAVDRLNGEIQITSTPGEGTRIQFEIPLDAVTSSTTIAPVANDTSVS